MKTIRSKDTKKSLYKNLFYLSTWEKIERKKIDKRYFHFIHFYFKIREKLYMKSKLRWVNGFYSFFSFLFIFFSKKIKLKIFSFIISRREINKYNFFLLLWFRQKLFKFSLYQLWRERMKETLTKRYSSIRKLSKIYYKIVFSFLILEQNKKIPCSDSPVNGKIQ